MTMSELATIVQEKINIKIAIINNGYLGMVRQWQEFFYDKRYVATPLVAPDFAALANAFGFAESASPSAPKWCPPSAPPASRTRLS